MLTNPTKGLWHHIPLAATGRSRPRTSVRAMSAKGGLPDIPDVRENAAPIRRKGFANARRNNRLVSIALKCFEDSPCLVIYWHRDSLCGCSFSPDVWKHSAGQSCCLSRNMGSMDLGSNGNFDHTRRRSCDRSWYNRILRLQAQRADTEGLGSRSAASSMVVSSETARRHLCIPNRSSNRRDEPHGSASSHS